MKESTRPALAAVVAGVVAAVPLAFAGGAAVPATPHAQSTPTVPQRQFSKVALVTGSTDGLGREVALRLAATGAHVIVHGRNVERGNEVVAQITREGKGSARFHRADLASLAAVRGFAEAILRDYNRLDLLVNNAGIIIDTTGRGAGAPNTRRLSADGHELVFAVNYLSGYLLTRLLLPRLAASAPSRIVNVSSLGQAPIDFDNVMLERGYTDGRAYSQSKLAQILFTFDLAKELEGSGVTVNALHPATYMATTMVRVAGATPRSTVAEGADAVMHVATAPGLASGQFFNGKTPARANAQAYDEAARDRLRELSRRLTGSR